MMHARRLCTRTAATSGTWFIRRPVFMCMYACLRSSTCTYGSRVTQLRSRLRLRLCILCSATGDGYISNRGVLLQLRVTLRRPAALPASGDSPAACAAPPASTELGACTYIPQPAPVVYMCMNAALASFFHLACREHAYVHAWPCRVQAHRLVGCC